MGVLPDPARADWQQEGRVVTVLVRRRRATLNDRGTAHRPIAGALPRGLAKEPQAVARGLAGSRQRRRRHAWRRRDRRRRSRGAGRTGTRLVPRAFAARSPRPRHPGGRQAVPALAPRTPARAPAYRPPAPPPTAPRARGGARAARLFIVHRLDRETSGLIVFAKSVAAKQHLQVQFAARTAERVYVALAEGVVRPDEGTLTQPLVEDRALRVRIAERGG